MPDPSVHQSWFGQTTFDESTNGIAAETCRDRGTRATPSPATMAAAETAHIQGDKLYESEEQRLIGVMEFHAHLLLRKEPAPKTVCGGNVKYAAGTGSGSGITNSTIALGNRCRRRASGSIIF